MALLLRVSLLHYAVHIGKIMPCIVAPPFQVSWRRYVVYRGAAIYRDGHCGVYHGAALPNIYWRRYPGYHGAAIVFIVAPLHIVVPLQRVSVYHGAAMACIMAPLCVYLRRCPVYVGAAQVCIVAPLYI